MLLSTPCKACQEQMVKSYIVSDRVKLAQKYGEEIKLLCIHCGANHVYLPDDFKAIHNRRLRLNIFFIALGLSFLGTLIGSMLFDFYSFSDYILLSIISAAPLIIFLFYIKHDTEANRMFNRLKLKGYNVNSQMTSTRDKVQITSVDKGSGMQAKINKMNKDNLPSHKKTEKN